MPGASPETMAATVAAPLERRLGQIADVAEMTSESAVGSTRVILQFGLDRDINGAARDVQAAINAARADLPTALRANPTYRKFNPAEAPILILALTSKTLTPGQLYDSAATILQQRLLQVDGIGNVDVGGSSLPAVRVDLDPFAPVRVRDRPWRTSAPRSRRRTPTAPRARSTKASAAFRSTPTTRRSAPPTTRDLVIAYRNGRPVLLARRRRGRRLGRESAQCRLRQRQSRRRADPVQAAGRQYRRDRRSREGGAAAAAGRACPATSS